MGITEFFLRYMAWLALKDDTYNNQDMCIIAGPRVELATDLIRRLKGLFLVSASRKSGLRIVFTEEHSNQKMLMLNNVRIRAFPSHNPNSIRLLKDPAFIFVDEADFFHQEQHFNVKTAAEGATTKSNPWIVFVSTPYKPRGFMHHMMNVAQDYYKFALDYNYGLPRKENVDKDGNWIGIYTKEEIDLAKQDTAFEQEYNLKFMGAIGTIFSTLHIKNAQQMQYDPSVINHYGVRVMGIDPGFGPSPVGLVVLQLGGDNQIQVIHADDYERLSSGEMINLIWEQIQKYNPNKIIIDGNNPEWVKDLKIQIGEDPNYLDVIARMRKDGFDHRKVMKVVPINFSQDGRAMLGNAKMLLETKKIAIHSKFDKLIAALGSAIDSTGEGRLSRSDKEEMAYSDVFDAFRMALFYFRTTKEQHEP